MFLQIKINFLFHFFSRMLIEIESAFGTHTVEAGVGDVIANIKEQIKVHRIKVYIHGNTDASQ